MNSPVLPGDRLRAWLESEIERTDKLVQRAAIPSDYDYYRGWRDACFKVQTELVRSAAVPLPPDEDAVKTARRIYELEQTVARLQRKIDAGPHRKWLETDDPDVVACMGSAQACAENGCQLTAAVPLAPDDAMTAQLLDAANTLTAYCECGGAGCYVCHAQNVMREAATERDRLLTDWREQDRALQELWGLTGIDQAGPPTLNQIVEHFRHLAAAVPLPRERDA